MIKTFLQKTEDLAYLGGEISSLICQKNTLAYKLQQEEQKGKQKWYLLCLTSPATTELF